MGSTFAHADVFIVCLIIFGLYFRRALETTAEITQAFLNVLPKCIDTIFRIIVGVPMRLFTTLAVIYARRVNKVDTKDAGTVFRQARLTEKQREQLVGRGKTPALRIEGSRASRASDAFGKKKRIDRRK